MVNYIEYKLPGHAKFHREEITPYDTIGDLSKRVADRLGVNKNNWMFVLQVGCGRPIELSDYIKLIDIDNGELYYSPRIVIR